MDTLELGDQIATLICKLTGEGMMFDLGWPQPFQGSTAERERNFRTHRWQPGYDARCVSCDCKAGSVSSFWPCGVEPPRVHRDGTVSMSVSPSDMVDMLAETEEPEGLL